ncbi:MFS general substrate transporter [Thozetella sp. PMI_491]|nr:MFS general substrate transporter [Thozetella sp. PMI_491]
MAGKDDLESKITSRASLAMGEVDGSIESGDAATSPEYAEYLRLSEIFVGDKLRTLVRKVDFRILPQLMILYLLAYIDRSNTGNVKLFGALEDMHLSGQDWNTALCVFFATYALGGTPSNIALKRWGPKYWLPTLLAVCGVINIIQGLQSSMAAFTCLRWRFIYIIEGIFTVAMGLLGLYFLSPNPSEVKNWLDDDERRFLVLRARFAHGGESGVHDENTFSWKYAKQAVKSIHVYAVALVEFTVAVVVYGISYVLPTIIAGLGYSAVKAQAMTAPPYVFACMVVLFSGWAADRYKQRAMAVILPNALASVGFIIIIASVRYTNIPGVTYFGIFLMAAGLYCISPSVMAWIALNCAGDMKRAVCLGLMISLSQLGGIVGSNIFLSREAPTYPTGFGICLAMLVLFGVIWPTIYWLILKRINARRAAIPGHEILAKYTEQELADMGDLSPLFRYAT